MPVCHSRKIIFVHIPKTAGTSIEIALGLYGDPKIINWQTLFGKRKQHMTAAEILSHFNNEQKDFFEYYRFSVVRNPFDRVVSEYRWKNKLLNLPFKDYAKSIPDRIKKGDQHVFPQASFLYSKDNKCLVNDIVRIEELSPFWSKFCALQLPEPIPLHRHNSTAPKPYQGYYDSETKQIIEDIYRDDLDLLGYSFDDSPEPSFVRTNIQIISYHIINASRRLRNLIWRITNSHNKTH